MVKERMDLLELLRKEGMDGDVDFLREALLWPSGVTRPSGYCSTQTIQTAPKKVEGKATKGCWRA